MNKFMDEKDNTSAEHVSLSTARCVLNIAVILSILGIAGGILVACLVWVNPLLATRDDLPPIPVKEVFTLARAEQWAKENRAVEANIKQAALNLHNAGHMPAELVSLFPAPTYVSIDVLEEYCKVSSSYGCLQKDTRIATMAPSRTFSVIASNLTTVTMTEDEMTKILVEYLPKVSVENRLNMMYPILVNYTSVNEHNKNADDAYHNRLAQIEDNYRANVALRTMSAGVTSLAAVFFAWYSFICLIACSGAIALLSIERHLRKMRINETVINTD